MNMTFVLGIMLLFFVLCDVINSAVPRAVNTRFSFAPVLVNKILWPMFSSLTTRISSEGLKAEVLSFFAPLALLTLLISWICMLGTAFALFSIGLDTQYSPPANSVLDALYISGTSILAIGPTSDFAPRTEMAKFLMLAGTLIGMLLIASVLSLMFGLISAIQPRETLVSIVSSVGGTPPSGIAILETYSQMQGRDCLQSFFNECHRWCADVLETHKAFPILPYFRSNDSLTSWLTALGAVLDASALMLSVDSRSCFSARMTYLLGSKLVNEFVEIFKLEPQDDEQMDDREFHDLYMRLSLAGYSSNGEEDAKENYGDLRLKYSGAHRALCKYLAVPLPSNNNENLPVIPRLQFSAGADNAQVRESKEFQQKAERAGTSFLPSTELIEFNFSQQKADSSLSKGSRQYLPSDLLRAASCRRDESLSA